MLAVIVFPLAEIEVIGYVFQKAIIRDNIIRSNWGKKKSAGILLSFEYPKAIKKTISFKEHK